MAGWYSSGFPRTTVWRSPSSRPCSRASASSGRWSAPATTSRTVSPCTPRAAPGSSRRAAGSRTSTPASTRCSPAMSRHDWSSTSPEPSWRSAVRGVAGHATEGRVDLYWLPLGAGGHCVRLNGRLYEAVAARLAGRERRALYHSALRVHLGADSFVIEMAPVWNTPDPQRGIVGEGPVGL